MSRRPRSAPAGWLPAIPTRTPAARNRANAAARVRVDVIELLVARDARREALGERAPQIEPGPTQLERVPVWMAALDRRADRREQLLPRRADPVGPHAPRALLAEQCLAEVEDRGAQPHTPAARGASASVRAASSSVQCQRTPSSISNVRCRGPGSRSRRGAPPRPAPPRPDHRPSERGHRDVPGGHSVSASADRTAAARATRAAATARTPAHAARAGPRSRPGSRAARRPPVERIATVPAGQEGSSSIASRGPATSRSSRRWPSRAARRSTCHRPAPTSRLMRR